MSDMTVPILIGQVIPKQPQRQDSLADQLADLRQLAIHLGMYDALDYLQRIEANRTVLIDTTEGE